MSGEHTSYSIDFVANPVQSAFITSKADADLFSSRRGEGKSVALCMSCLYHTRHNPGARWAFIRDTFENLQKTTMKTFFEWFKDGIHGRYNYTRKEWTWAEPFAKGSVLFMGMDEEKDIASLQGLELAGVAMDEAAPGAATGGIREVVFSMAMSSLRQPGMKWYSFKVAQNNSDESHWTYRKFVDPGTPPDLSYERMPLQVPGYKLWQPQTPENLKHLPTGYYERIRAEFVAMGRTDLARRFVDGQFGFQELGKSCTPQWSDQLHLATGLTPIRGRPLHMLWDFGHCCDGETEVLTLDGWKSFPELTGKEALATWSPAQRLVVYQQPTALHTKEVDRIWEYENSTISIGVSAEHRLVGYGGGRDGQLWRERTAEEVAGSSNPHLHIPLIGARLPDEGVKPPVHPGLVGFYVAEGCTDGTRVTLYQKQRDPCIQAMLEATPYVWTWEENAKGGYWRTNSRELADHLKGLGTAKTKRLPAWFRGLSGNDMQTLLWFYVMGDGHYRRHERGGELVAFTTSTGLADDLQELAFLIGYSPRVMARVPARSWYEAEQRWIENDGGFDIAFRTCQTAPLRPKKHGRWVEGVQRVYCATVPNGTLVVRRRGRVHITGNSPTCIISQLSPMGEWLILDALVGDGIGVVELIENELRPLWMDRYEGGRHALVHIGDPAGSQRSQVSIMDTPVAAIKKNMGGTWKPGPVAVDLRLEPLRAVLTQTVLGRGKVQVDRERAKPVHWALRGGYHFNVSPSGITSTTPVKDMHSHVGDAMGYGAAVLFPLRKLGYAVGEGTTVSTQPGLAFGRGRSGGRYAGSPGRPTPLPRETQEALARMGQLPHIGSEA